MLLLLSLLLLPQCPAANMDFSAAAASVSNLIYADSITIHTKLGAMTHIAVEPDLPIICKLPSLH